MLNVSQPAERSVRPVAQLQKADLVSTWSPPAVLIQAKSTLGQGIGSMGTVCIIRKRGHLSALIQVEWNRFHS